ncbi:putative uridine kinase [Saccharomycopsis crataegensis]|uniref:Uridine kinase n=1 Tax=Saccharomycopsis crataegensis TaxID=43959 RepID=A0AAV5QNV0_9ASCO|nr:putative uridine kinase [Saccharomycopsis crataegensis]
MSPISVPSRKDSSASSCAIILIGGGQSSGKSTASRIIARELEESLILKDLIEIKLIDMDDYLFSKLNAVQSNVVGGDDKVINDGMNDLRLSATDLQDLDNEMIESTGKSNEMTEMIKNKNVSILLPNRFNFKKLREDIINYSKHSASKKFPIFIVHGLYALYDKQLNKLALMKIFIDIDADTRLVRWIQNDTVKNKLPLEDVIDQYLKFSRPEFAEFIFPTKENSDTILTRGAEIDDTGIILICDGLVPFIVQKIKKLNAKTTANELKDIDDFKKDASANTHAGSNSEGEQITTVTTNTSSDENDEPKEKLDVSGLHTLNIKGEEFTDQRGRFYDLT